MNNNTIYRQGDVLIARTNLTAIPEGANPVPLDAGRVVLAYGEVTGHAHALPGTLASMYRWQGDTLVEIAQATAVTHEEHAPVPLAPGVYRIIRQREYAPKAPPRYVAD